MPSSLFLIGFLPPPHSSDVSVTHNCCFICRRPEEAKGLYLVHLNHMLEGMEGQIRGEVGGRLRACGGEAQKE